MNKAMSNTKKNASENANETYDLIVIGSGPAGQKAAVQAAKSKKKVVLIEKSLKFGGSCVHTGTIPSKTLRENALRIQKMRENAEIANVTLSEDLEIATLIKRLGEVLNKHDKYMREQLERNNITMLHGRAKFTSENEIELTNVYGETTALNFRTAMIATGSHPRNPDNIAIDHEHLFDSDSILSMLYLPTSLTVLGGGVIASEYASIFQALGVKVTMVDKYPTPLGFLDSDLTAKFINAFESMGGTWLGNKTVEHATWNGFDKTITNCSDGTVIHSDKLLCAAGRFANVKELDIAAAGIELTDSGMIKVDENLATSIKHIFAAGDVIGQPSLASASMEQGRRAACNAFNIPIGQTNTLIPSGIYSIPELSAVGLTEKQAISKFHNIIFGRADFKEIARGQISGIQDGMLKVICDGKGEKLLGVMIVGEGATELIHIGQMALLSEANVDIFVESIFNFPTLAEAYRVAALDVIGQRSEKTDAF